jgi:hypothetical protein
MEVTRGWCLDIKQLHARRASVTVSDINFGFGFVSPSMSVCFDFEFASALDPRSFSIRALMGQQTATMASR